MRTRIHAVGLVSLIALAGCTGSRAGRAVARPSVQPPPPATAATPTAPPSPRRTTETIKAEFERAKRDQPHIPMLTQEEAHKAMPTMFRGRDMPTLMLVAGLQPKSMEAVMGVARASRTEGDLDAELLNDVFWTVSSVNECFY